MLIRMLIRSNQHRSRGRHCGGGLSFFYFYLYYITILWENQIFSMLNFHEKLRPGRLCPDIDEPRCRHRQAAHFVNAGHVVARLTRAQPTSVFLRRAQIYGRPRCAASKRSTFFLSLFFFFLPQIFIPFEIKQHLYM